MQFAPGKLVCMRSSNLLSQLAPKIQILRATSGQEMRFSRVARFGLGKNADLIELHREYSSI
jgi:hypothetical protein